MAMAPSMAAASTGIEVFPITLGTYPSENIAYLSTRAGIPNVNSFGPTCLVNSMYVGCASPGCTICLNVCIAKNGFKKTAETGFPMRNNDFATL